MIAFFTFAVALLGAKILRFLSPRKVRCLVAFCAVLVETGAYLIETSAKTGHNVGKLHTVARDVVECSFWKVLSTLNQRFISLEQSK